MAAGATKPLASSRKRRAESTRGKRVIIASQAISSGSVERVCGQERWRQSKVEAKRKRESFCRHNFRQAKCNTRFSNALQDRKRLTLIHSSDDRWTSLNAAPRPRYIGAVSGPE